MPRMTLRAFALLAVSFWSFALSAQPANTGASAATPTGDLELATFAAGCFWCTEADFDKVAGVVETTSGYMGGKTPNPTYKQVSAGGTGHAEVVQLRYDPTRVTYRQLLDAYWRNVDPLDKDGQFCDRGDQYRPAIFYHNEEQKRLAEESKSVLQTSGRFKQPIAVEITSASTFTRAEDYHQDYYLKQPIRYTLYRHGCARDTRLEALWGPLNSQ